MEGAHGELRAGLADGLRGDDADRFAHLDRAARREIAAVAVHASAATRFAGQHRANLDALDAGRLNRIGQLFGDFLIDLDDDVAFVVFNLTTFTNCQIEWNAAAARAINILLAFGYRFQKPNKSSSEDTSNLSTEPPDVRADASLSSATPLPIVKTDWVM